MLTPLRLPLPSIQCLLAFPVPFVCKAAIITLASTGNKKPNMWMQCPTAAATGSAVAAQLVFFFTKQGRPDVYYSNDERINVCNHREEMEYILFELNNK